MSDQTTPALSKAANEAIEQVHLLIGECQAIDRDLERPAYHRHRLLSAQQRMNDAAKSFDALLGSLRAHADQLGFSSKKS